MQRSRKDPITFKNIYKYKMTRSEFQISFEAKKRQHKNDPHILSRY